MIKTIFLLCKQYDEFLKLQIPKGSDWQTNAVPVEETLNTKQKYKNTRLPFIPKLLQQQNEVDEREHYTKLCRGEILRVKFKHFCNFTHMNLQPFKDM